MQVLTGQPYPGCLSNARARVCPAGAYGVDEQVLAYAQIDLHSNHYYPASAERLLADAALCAAASKPLVVMEYGWTDNRTAIPFLAAAEATAAVAGTAFWSIFPHADRHGFVQHADGFTFHWPGDDEWMREFGRISARHAWKMSAAPKPPPLRAPPLAPRVTAVNATHVAWAGAPMAVNYSVELRAPSPGASWRLACDRCATDNETPIRLDVPAGSSVRVTGYGQTGLPSVPSKVWPP